MKKSQEPDPKPKTLEQLVDIASPGTKPSRHEMAQMWDLVTRVHYLAHDMRNRCSCTGLPSLGSAFVLAEVMQDWAACLGEELEALEASIRSPGGDKPA